MRNAARRGEDKPAAPWLTLRLLGGCDFLTPEGAIYPETAKTSALLVYLALHPHPQQRRRLMALLWGDLPEERAQGNLRRALWDLKRKLQPPDGPPYLLVDRQTVAFNRARDHRLDVTDFEQAAQDAAPASWKLAVERYQGDFLEGFHVANAPDFEEWMLMEQERLRLLALQTLSRLVAHHEERGHYAAAIQYATRLLAMNPWQEETHRTLMRLLALRGQRGAALAQYQACRRLLAKELGLEPLEETTRLYEQILTGQIGPLEEQMQASSRPATPTLPFVGRDDEHARLVTWWRQARRGDNPLTLVIGDAGVGKTRLVQEVLHYARAQGARILEARCYEFDAAVAYQPVADALRAQALHYPSREVRVNDVWLAELARLLPDLRAAAPHLPPPIHVSGEAAPQRLFEAVARFLLDLCDASAQPDAPDRIQTPRPVILFLDDLHWADPSTLDLLHYLVRRLQGAPLWLVAAYRGEEVGPDHSLMRLRQGLGREHLVQQMTLTPLTPQAVAAIAHRLTGEAPPGLAAFLYRESEGNPFILTETIHDLREAGRLHPDEQGRWQWNGSPPADDHVPAAVQDVILQRVGRLDAAARRLLILAAAIGRHFDLELLTAAAGADAAAVDASLDAWLARHLVRQEREAAHRTPHAPHYDFSHDKIRAVLYHQAQGERPRLHRRVAEALERLYAGRLAPVWAPLAHHWDAAGCREQALTYLPLAAAQAMTAYAGQEALTAYDRMLALLDATDPRWLPTLLQRGRVLRFLGRYEEAAADCRAVVEADGDQAALLAVQACIELGRIHHLRREYETARTWTEAAERLLQNQIPESAQARQAVQAEARLLLAEIEHAVGNLDRALDLFQELLVFHREAGDQPGVVDSLMGQGRVLTRRGEHPAACARYEEALALARSLGDVRREADCLRRLGESHWRQEKMDAAHTCFQDGLRVARAIGDRLMEAACLNGLGLVAVSRDEIQATQGFWEQAAHIFHTLDLENRLASSLHNLAILHMVQGDYPAAEKHLEESLAVNRRLGARIDEALDLGWLGKLHLLRGEYDRARDFVETALTLDADVGGVLEEHWHYAWLGAIAYEQGRLEEAEEHLQRAAQLAQARGVRLGAMESAWPALVRLARGDGKTALKLARCALAEAEADGDRVAVGCLNTALGGIYASGLVAGEEDPAPYFRRGLEALAPGEPYLHGVALRRFGAYLLAWGELTQGRAYLEEAQALFRRLGAQGELGKVTRLLAGQQDPRLAW